MANTTPTDVLGRQIAVGDTVSFETTNHRKGVSELGFGSIKSINASTEIVLVDVSVPGRKSQFVPCDLSVTKITKID